MCKWISTKYRVPFGKDGKPLMGGDYIIRQKFGCSVHVSTYSFSNDSPVEFCKYTTHWMPIHQIDEDDA